MLELKPFSKNIKYDFKLNCEVIRSEGDFTILYILTGPLDQLEIPINSGTEPKRMNGLWETTCFEAFIKNVDYSPYLEFNFAPSGHWNSFIFKDYREGMQEYLGIKKMHVELKSSESELRLSCNFNMKRPKGFVESDFAGKKMRMGLSAVLHLKNDQKLFYALNHPVVKPDFHHEEGFNFKII